MTGVEVRVAEASDDLARAGRIIAAAYGALQDYPVDPEYDAMVADVAGRAADACIVVGLVDGRLAGCLTYVPGPGSPDYEFTDPDGASFRYFGVDPAVQGRGLGAAMVQWCIDRARTEGRRRLLIHTLESMGAAQQLYARMGFERREDLDEWWDGTIHGLAFARELADREDPAAVV